MDNPRFEGWSRYRWENQVTRRYYEARVQLNNFGSWVVFAVWGGIGIRLGGSKVIEIGYMEDANVVIGQMAKKPKKTR